MITEYKITENICHYHHQRQLYGGCKFQYQVQRYDKSSARTSFGDL